jgi:hypothetical protein
MKMSNSSLVNYTAISPNSSNPRNNKIKKITIHHMAGNLSVETCGRVFNGKNRQASSNYGIGSDGRVGMYVEEKNRAWTSSSPSNDNQAITIEVANDGGANTNWHVSDKALAKLIDLCVDICKRNGIASLNYTGDANGNLTRHNMFANTTCPGPYLQSKFPYIASEVNKRLNGSSTSVPSNDISSKSVDELAKEVIAGKYGNGDARKSALGSRYGEVQARVNEILIGNKTTPTPAPQPTESNDDLLTLVKKTIRGDFGNGDARKKALGSRYDEVQKQVNANLNAGLTRWDNIKLF